MNAIHFHLLLNHIPIVGIIIGILILTAGFFLKNISVKRTALAVLFFSAITAIPAFLSGERAEHLAEDIPGIAHQLIEEHEEAAAIFIWLIAVTGILSGAAFLLSFSKRKLLPILYVLVFLLAIASIAAAVQTGTSGGEIRHTELHDSLPV